MLLYGRRRRFNWSYEEIYPQWNLPSTASKFTAMRFLNHPRMHERCVMSGPRNSSMGIPLSLELWLQPHSFRLGKVACGVCYGAKVNRWSLGQSIFYLMNGLEIPSVLITLKSLLSEGPIHRTGYVMILRGRPWDLAWFQLMSHPSSKRLRTLLPLILIAHENFLCKRIRYLK